MQAIEKLRVMGIEVWQERKPPVLQQLDAPAPILSSNSTIEWGELKTQALSCTACDLHKTRTHVVFGVGNPQAKLMLIGEAPGAQEDQKGEPFVGRAGQLLNGMLKSIHLERSDIYIANILKCRPPNNRDPQPQEVALCTGFLRQQIALIQPQLIVALGRIAAHFLLETQTPVSRLREQLFTLKDDGHTPLMVTFHPAYLLRSPLEKAKAYQDWLRVSSILRH